MGLLYILLSLLLHHAYKHQVHVHPQPYLLVSSGHCTDWFRGNTLYRIPSYLLHVLAIMSQQPQPPYEGAQSGRAYVARTPNVYSYTTTQVHMHIG